MNYVVEVVEPPPSDRSAVVAHIATSFGIPESKAARLLARAPGPVTKPVSKAEADAVAGIFRGAGLRIEVRAVEPPKPAVADPIGGAVATHDTLSGSRMPAAQPPAADGPRSDPRPHPTPPVEDEDETTDDEEGLLQMDDASAPVDLADRSAFDDRNSDATGFEPAPRGDVASEVAEVEKTLSEASFPASRPAVAPRPRRGRGSLRRRILTAGVVPALLTIVFALGAVVLTLGPTLRTQLLEAARNPAVAFASAIEGLLAERDLASDEVRDALQMAAERARADFEAQSIEFVLVTDTAGNRLAGWPAPNAIPTVLLPAIQSQALGAQARAYGTDNGIEFGDRNPPSRRVTIGGSSIEVASSAIRGTDASIGAVVVGITNASLNQRIRSVLLTAAGAGLIPVLVALIAALALTRALTRNIYYLIESADRISRGELTDEVQLESNDELSDLAAAIERMRLSLQEAIERLRRRRRP